MPKDAKGSKIQGYVKDFTCHIGTSMVSGSLAVQVVLSPPFGSPSSALRKAEEAVIRRPRGARWISGAAEPVPAPFGPSSSEGPNSEGPCSPRSQVVAL